MKLPKIKINPAWLAWAAVTTAVAAVAYLTGGKIDVPTPPVPDEPIFISTGWIDDPAERDATIRAAGIGDFSETPAGKAALGPVGDVFLWQAVRKVAGAGKPANWYPNVNQKSVGCCVGCGGKHSADVTQAVQILNGIAAEWKPVSVEAIYGGSRVEVGGGRIRGDGSVGAWAADWMSRRGGLLPMEKYPNVDLTEFSPERAREWGRLGVPDDLEPLAKAHPVKSAALVRTWDDVVRSVTQGYAIMVCSNVGFDGMNRDRDGFIRPSGNWPHCMSIIGLRGGDRPGAFILNSWGDAAHRGPVWPADAPVAGFWVDAAVVGRMVGQGDSYALSDVTGFPARTVPLDWFARAPRSTAAPLASLAW